MIDQPNSGDVIERTMAKKGEAIARVLKRLQGHFGEVQIIARTVESTLISLAEAHSPDPIHQDDLQVLVRRYGQKSTGFQVAQGLDFDRLVSLVESAPRIPPTEASNPGPGHHARHSPCLRSLPASWRRARYRTGHPPHRSRRRRSHHRAHQENPGHVHPQPNRRPPPPRPCTGAAPGPTPPNLRKWTGTSPARCRSPPQERRRR